jgi:tetratricopeptide (TPR) repeat protein
MVMRNLVCEVIALLCVLSAAVDAYPQTTPPEQNEQIALERQFTDLLDAQDLASALALAEKIVNVAERDSGADSEPHARAMFNLAGLYGVTNNLEKATELFMRSVETFERSISERPTEFFDVLLPAADFLIQQARRNDLAKRILERSSALYEQRDEVLLPQRTEVYRRLAHLYIQSDDQRALAKTSRRVQELRSLHEQLATTLHGDEAKFQESVGQGLFDRAITLARSLADTARRLYGTGSEQHVRAISNIGAAYERMHDYENAFLWVERALGMARKQANSRVHADLLENSARLLFGRLRFDEAAQMLREEYEVMQLLEGPKHPNTARVLSDLAEALKKQGKISAAIEIRSKALAVW